MTDTAINAMFSPYEWQDAECAHCCEFKGCVSMGGVPSCYECLEKYYDDDGNELPMNVYSPEPKSISGTSLMLTLAVIFAMIPLGFVLGNLASFAIVVIGGVTR